MDGNMPRARIKACSICDPFVLILREDETIGLFIGETERGKIRRKDMSPMGEKVMFDVVLCHRQGINGVPKPVISVPCRMFLHRHIGGFRNDDNRRHCGRFWQC